MKTNSFNQEIPEIKDLFKDTRVEEHIINTLKTVLEYLEINNPEELINTTLNKAKNYKSLEDYEKTIHQLFDKKRITQGIPVKLGNRAKIMFNQIKDYLEGHQVLDLGCGDGKVGELISKQGRQVILADVYKNGNITNIELPFVQIKQKGRIPFEDNLFDTTLLLTVLHHSDNPTEVISEARRVTKNKGKIIVIESVYGVKDYGGKLTDEQQRRVNIFFDHFYNRVIHYSEFKENKVNVPFNFQSPEKWKIFFNKNGLVQRELVKLGFDQKTVPEYHTLHVLEVKK